MAPDDQLKALMCEMTHTVSGYPAERRYALAIMQDLQKRHRYLSREALELVAAHVDAPLSLIYALATFYKGFSLVPRGRATLKVCDGTACHVKGSSSLVAEARQLLGIVPGETTPDGELTLETVSCVGACALGPLVVVDEEYHGHMTADGLSRLVDEILTAEERV